MKSSNTSSWDSATSRQSSVMKEIANEALVTTTTRELVEFYWSNRKRFSGSYEGFPVEVS